jgi:integrase
VPGNSLEAAQAKFNPRALTRPGNFSSIGEVIDLYKAERVALDVKEETAKRYYGCLINILRRVHAWRKGVQISSLSGVRGSEKTEWPKWTKLSLTVLDERLLEDYKKLMLEGDGEELDEEEALTAKVTTDSNIRQARSLFGEDAMRLYNKRHLALPDLSGFMGVSLFNAKKYFELAPAAVVRRIFLESAALKSTNLSAYRVLFAAVHCGMRRAEIAALQMPWLEDEDPPTIKLRERGEFKPKHGHGRTIEVEQWVAAELRAIAASPARYMEEDANRRDLACRQLVEWLQARGIEAPKPLHELRKLWGCYIAKSKGLLAAQKMLGHHDANTTSKFYADNRLAADLIPFWTRSSNRTA